MKGATKRMRLPAIVLGVVAVLAVALDAGLVRLLDPLLAWQRVQAGAHVVGTVALHAGEAVDLRMRSVDASLELLGDLRKVVLVTVHAQRRGITEAVWELVERLRIRARVAFDAVEARVDAHLPSVPVEDPEVGDGLGWLHVALDTRLGRG